MADRTPSGTSSEQSKRAFLEILAGSSPSSSSSSIISDPPLNGGGVHLDSFGPQQHTSSMYLSSLSSLSSTNTSGVMSGNSEPNTVPSKFPSYLSYRGTHADTSSFNRPNTGSHSSASSLSGVDSIQQLLQEAMKGRQTSNVAWKDAFSSESTSVSSTPTTSASRKSPDTSKQEPESNDTATLLASLANPLTTDTRFPESTPALRSTFSAGSISKTPTSVPFFPMTLYPTEDNEKKQPSKSPLLLEEKNSGLANAFSSISTGLSNTRFQESSNFGDNEKPTKYSYVSPFNVLDACINQQQSESSPPNSSILPIPELESTRYDEDPPMILLDTSPSTHHGVEDEEGGGESDIPSSPTSTPVPVSKGILRKKKKKGKKNRGDTQTQQSSAFNSTSPFEIHQNRDDTHVSSVKKKKGESSRGSGGNGGTDPDSDNGRQPSPSAHFASDASSTPLLLQENDPYLMSRQYSADTTTSPTPAVSYTLTSPSPTFFNTFHTKRRSTMTSFASSKSNQQLEQNLANNEMSPGTAPTHTLQKKKTKSFSEAQNYTSNQPLDVDSSFLFPVQSVPSNAFAFDISVQQKHDSLVQFHVSLDQLPSVEFKYLVSDVFRQSVRSQFLEASATAIAYLEGQHLVITLLTTQRTYHFDTSPHVTALVLHSNYLVLVHVESLSIYQLHPRDVRLLYGIQFHQANANPVHVRHALILSPHTLVAQCQAGDRNEEYLLVLDLIHLESPTKDDEDHPILVGPDQPNCRRIETPLTCLSAAGISNYFLACSEHTVTLWHGLKPSRTFQVDSPISSVFRLTHTENYLNLLIGVNHNSEFWVVAVSRKSHVPSQILSQLAFPQTAFTISFDGSLLLLHHADEIVVVRMIETQWTSIYKVCCSETSVIGMALTSSHFLIALPSQIVECHLPSQSVFVNTLHPELSSPLHFTAQSMSANHTHSSSNASSFIAMKKHRASKVSKVDEVPFSTIVASSMEMTKRSSTNSSSSSPPLSLIPPSHPLLPAPHLAPRPPSIKSPVVAPQGGGAQPSLDAEWIQYVDSKVAQLELNLERQIQEQTQKVTQALTSATQQWRQDMEETQQTLKQISETLHPMIRPLSQPDMTQSLMDSLLPMLRKSIQTQFSKTLIPAYEKATQLMFQQLADMLSPLTLPSTSGEDATMESWNKSLSHPPQLLMQLRSLKNLETSITSLPLSYQLRLLKTLDFASDPSMAFQVLEVLVPLLCSQVTKSSDIAPVLHHCLTQLEQLDRNASLDFQLRQSVWVLSHSIRSGLK